MKTLPLKKQWVSLALLGSLLFAGEDASAQLADCPSLGDALVEHSCFHARFGPFTTVLATEGDGVTAATPNVDAVHTEFRVGLAGPVSSITYAPAPERSGTWTLFRDTDVPVRLIDASEEVLLPTFEVEGNTGCDALPLASAFELEAEERYRIEFGPTSADHVVVVLEYLEDFVTENGRDDDRDGYGRPDDVVVTACSPPAGYAQNALDCNDHDSEVHPGAAEICDGIDQNCNSLVDDEGLTCRLSQGVCQAVGTVFCSGEGALAECSAAPASPTQEVCNGLDDDCDGEIDNGTELCSEPDAPTCVRQGSGAFCGCLIDLDCGPSDSGTVCDTSSRRCVSGCSALPGHNGCPSGEECDASTTPGSCVEGVATPTDPEPPGDGDDDEPPVREFEPAPSGCGCTVAGAGSSTLEVRTLGLLSLLGLALRRRYTKAPFTLAQSLPAVARSARRLLCVLSLLLAANLAQGCGGRAEMGKDIAASPELDGTPSSCGSVLDSSVVGHSCTHITNGPYVITVPTSDSSTAPDVSRIHTPFEVDMLETPSELRYSPTRDGTHVIFLGDLEVEVVVLKGELEIAAESFVVDGCELVEKGIAIELEIGESYRFFLPKRSGAPFLLFVEHLGAFGEDAWEQSCP